MYTVKLIGVNSEGDPLTMTWATRVSAIAAVECVAQILMHKSESENMIGSDVKLFNGAIEITEEMAS